MAIKLVVQLVNVPRMADDRCLTSAAESTAANPAARMSRHVGTGPTTCGVSMPLSPEPLHITTRITSERIMMTVRGEIDIATAPQFGAAMTDRLARDPAVSLHLDLSGVDFIDCTGVQALLVAQRTARLLGGDLILTRTSRQVDRLLTLLRLESAFAVESDVSDVISA
jgi:anti-sigma B factor antagonist